jgi:hypothetical protein
MHARSVDLVHTKKVKPRSVVDSMCTVSSDESVELQELSLDLHTTNLEMKRLLALSSIES